MADVSQEHVGARPRASRVRGCRAMLKRLRRIRIQIARVQNARAVDQAEVRWCARAADALDGLIREGEAVLPQRLELPDRRIPKGQLKNRPAGKRGAPAAPPGG